MSFSSGTYSLYATGNPVVTNTTISSTWANNTLNDIATALSTCVLKDGTQTTTASVPFAVGIDVTTAATTTSTTFACFNTNATTVNAFGAASVALNIGNASAAAAFAGGISIPTGKNVTGAGTATVTGFATVSATTLTGTLSTATQNSVTTMTGLVTVGALASGSIASGFGSINIGANALTAGAATFSGILQLATAVDHYTGSRFAEKTAERVSVTGATTIITNANSGVAASGIVAIVTGYDTGATTKTFTDLVLSVAGGTVTTIAGQTLNTPAARTYTMSGNSLQLAMASSTYNVSTYLISASN